MRKTASRSHKAPKSAANGDRPSFPPEAPLNCVRCPRLAAFLEGQRRCEPGWHNAPVRSFGTDEARLLIVGLAPGLKGANRTGRPFTGDYAGDLLYAALAEYGFSSGCYQARADDGLVLEGAMISNAVRCVPPGNKPTATEINCCRPYLAARIAALPRLAVILALGRIAHDSTLRTLGARLKDHPFSHGARHDLTGNVALFDSYHCSRYNTNTRRLTSDMFRAVFEDIRNYLGRR